MVNYGRHKFVLGQEARTSSTKLLTVERSAISNKVYGSYRPTGLSVDGTMDKLEFHRRALQLHHRRRGQ